MIKKLKILKKEKEKKVAEPLPMVGLIEPPKKAKMIKITGKKYNLAL